MKKIIFLNLFLLVSAIGIAQKNKIPTINDALKKYDFIEGQVVEKSDTITYYLKNYKTKPSNLIVYIQGTDPNPIFSYSKKNGKTTISRWFADDYLQVDSTYTFAIIPKPGIAGIYDESNLSIPEEYYKNNYLEYRVNQIDVSIKDIVKNHLEKPQKIIVYGHSEGATIAAALASKNDAITHLGFWSGNVLNNFYEFSLFNRIESLTEKQSDSLAHENIMGIIEWYKSVIDNPNSTEIDHFGYTNKRWSSYEKPPIEYLLELDIPIFAYFATEDESTPIETAYLLPIQFMQKRKLNLTFKVCLGCNHSYEKEINGVHRKNWNNVFMQFINWTNQK
ncbi:hypothetical protein IMCC3317_32230 [Kordia antarctica]|uniref:Uncharacterized protein n=1 Tax=Kordia antarctica TaxID=1218801 RepID=A0A7L4ZMX5_9FLAO|nr:hypothetical protein [Kordia antarctica]QHI37840.1 hypothetical protein IMCC3317_32230 [Kordia antarctica]